MHQIAAFIMIAVLAFALPLEANAAKKQSSGENPKYGSIVVDAETGAVILQSNADKILHPASLTKVMTLLLLFEAMESGNVRLSDKIYISERAASQAPSKIGLPAGSSIRVEDAILALVTKSANDISVAIAEHLAGSESRFAQRMTYRGQSIGMMRTTYRNAHGLHDPRQVTTPRDQAILARYVIARYPNYYRYFSTKQFTYRGKTYTNHNRLMQTYPGMDGFKTGFVNASGFNLIASAKKGDRRLIGVVFGGRSWKTRNDHMASLLNTGFVKAPKMQYAGNTLPLVQAPVTTTAAAPAPNVAAPIPVAKPIFQVTENAIPIAPRSVEMTNTTSFTSLNSLGAGKPQIVLKNVTNTPTVVPVPAPDVTGEAIATVKSAINNGEYSELTGQGDYDAATTRRIETGLLSAAVYKGEARYQKKTLQNLEPKAGTVVDPEQDLVSQLEQGDQPNAVQPVSLPPQTITPASELWSVQIGAYNSRVATDDALRRSLSKLPPALSHGSPIVVPLKTSEGVLFRARLGNFSKAQAVDACRYFRDCLPVAPR